MTSRRSFLDWLLRWTAVWMPMFSWSIGREPQPEQCNTGGDPTDADVSPIKATTDDLPRWETVLDSTPRHPHP